MLTTLFPQGRARARAFAIFGAATGSGGVVGMVLGGVLTSYGSWRWCLLINLPLGLAVLAVAVLNVVVILVTSAQSTLDADAAVRAGYVAGFVGSAVLLAVALVIAIAGTQPSLAGDERDADEKAGSGNERQGRRGRSRQST